MGAARGEAGIPANWLRDLEASEIIARVADDLFECRSWNLDDPTQNDRVWERYPGW